MKTPLTKGETMHRYLSALKHFLLESPYAWLRRQFYCRRGKHVWYISMKVNDVPVKKNCRYCPADFAVPPSMIEDWPDNQNQPTPTTPILVNRPGSKATRQNLSKFMKHHGKQLPSYRKSIKAKKKPILKRCSRFTLKCRKC